MGEMSSNVTNPNKVENLSSDELNILADILVEEIKELREEIADLKTQEQS